MVGQILAEAAPLLRMLTLDGEGCHQLILKSVFGNLSEAERGIASETPFFRDLRHRPLPSSCLPRVPMMCCLHRDEEIFAMPGVLHVIKNASSQACSPGKVLFFGRYICDAVGLLGAGVPVPAYTRRDPMSDRHNALLNNPFFLAASLAAGLHIMAEHG